MTNRDRSNEHRGKKAWKIGGLMMVVAGCSNAPPPADDVVDVEIRDIAFDPHAVTIQVGQSVRWTNREPTSIPHTTTSGNPDDVNAGFLWDSSRLDPGESFTFQFNEVGEFVYFCDFHEDVPAMRDAMVIVEP